MADRPHSILTLLFCMTFLSLQAAPRFTSLNGNPAGGVEIRVLASDVQSTTLEMTLSGYYQDSVEIQGQTWQQITAKGLTPLLEAGAPDLPKLHRSIIIPDGARMEISILDAEWIDLDGMRVAPSKGNLLRTQDPQLIPYSFGSPYAENDFYPSEIAILGTPYILRDYRGQVVQIHPFRYNPLSNTLRVYTRIRVQVALAGFDARGNRSVQHSHSSSAFRSIYAGHFLNFDQAGVFYEAPQETGSLLIISDPDFLDALQPLVTWKQQRGIPTELLDVSSIGNNISAIQNAITSRYNSDMGLTYVLLVGDHNEVVPKQAAGAAADPTYGCVDGGNGDWYPDLFVGRFSATTVAQVETQVAKVLLYERDQMAATDWPQRGIGIASDQGAGQGDDGEADYVHMGNIRTDLLNYGYLEVDEIYDPGATGSDVAAAVNAGRGFINYVGHGSTTAWGTSGFSVSQVNNLNNTGMLPVINSVACVNGNFAGNTCFAEAWLRAGTAMEPRGAIAFYGSSINQSWAPPMCAQDETTDLLVAEVNTVVGALLMDGSCQMMDEYGSGGYDMFATWHIFGDPSLLMRTQAAQDLVDVSLPDVLVIGSSDMDVDLPPGLQGTAALTRDGEILSAVVLDGGSTLHMDFEALAEPDSLTLTITAFNHTAFMTDLLVIAPDGPYLVPSGLVCDDASSGNSNTQADYAETLDLYVDLRNVGTDPATAIQVDLASNDPSLTLLNNNATLDLVEVDSSRLAGPFAIQVAADVLDGAQVLLDVEIQTGSQQWTGQLSLPLHAPAANLEATTVQDDNNQRLDIGESAQIALNFRNTGTCPLNSGSVSLSSDDPVVTLDGSSCFFGPWLSGDSLEALFPVDVAYATPPNHPIEFNWVMDGTDGYLRSGSFILAAGQVIEDFESGNFETFDWTFTGHLPWSITTSETYQGTYSARSGSIGATQHSDLNLLVNVTGDSEIRFQQRTSSAAGDRLRFLMDGSELGAWDGETDWSQVMIAVPAGEHEFTWRYEKDSYTNSGEDCAWVDFIVMPSMAVPGTIIGDVTGDTAINVQDILRLVRIILGEGAPPSDPELYCGDVNGDGGIDIADLVLLVSIIMN